MAAITPDRTPNAVVFSGQGAQTPHMGKAHHQHLPAFRRAYDEAREVLGFDPLAAAEGGHSGLKDPEIVQPLLIAYGVATWRALAETGFRAQWFAGHSLGEVAAFVAAGSMDFDAALLFARERARAMAACPPGGMRAVMGLDDETVTACLEDHGAGEVTAANRNLPDQVVISGAEKRLPSVVEALEEAGGTVVPVRVAVAAHSALMRDAEEHLGHFAANLALREPQTPILSTLTGRTLSTAEEVRANLSQAMTRCVDWVAVVDTLRGYGVTQVVECGPRTILRDLVQTMAPGIAAASVADVDGLSLLGISIEETDTRAFAQRALRLLAGTPRRHHGADIEAETADIYATLQRLVDDPDSSTPSQVRRLLDQALAAKGFDESTRTRLVAQKQGETQ